MKPGISSVWAAKLERADKTTRILDVKYFILLPSVAYIGTPYDDIQWSARAEISQRI